MVRQITRKIMWLALMVLIAANTAWAAYPERPITLIVPFGAGGGTDIPARLLSGMMEKKLGKSIVVQNISGAAGTLGAFQTASAKPDGYTLGYMPIGTMCLQPHLMKLPYGVDDFDFIGMAVLQPVVAMSSKKAPWKNFEEFKEIVSKNPGKFVIGITSKGNMTHVPMLALLKHFNLDMRVIPYRNSTEIFKDMMAGRTHLFADAPAALSSYDIFGLVQFAPERASNLADIPTAKECGLDIEFAHWMGIVGPKGMPAEARQTLEKVMEEVVTSEEFKQEAIRIKTAAHWVPSDEFRARYYEELDLYKGILEENGLIGK